MSEQTESPPVLKVQDLAETLGVVGESGCGKSTLARAVLGLVRPRRGRVLWLGEDLVGLGEKALRSRRKELQIIFQDPLASLNPRMTVGDIIAEPLWTFYPKIARALVLNPRLIICDEPVSALDVSIQAQIINLLKDLQRKLSLSLIFIAHDLAVVKHISDRVMVMYLGRSMEVSRSEHLYRRPLHPYTSALVKAVPIPDPGVPLSSRDTGLRGDMPSPLDPPSGCVFHTRCPYAVKRCELEVPPLRRLPEGDWVACHLAEDLDLTIVKRP